VENPNLRQNGGFDPYFNIFSFLRGHFCNLPLSKRRSFDFSTHFDCNTNGGGQNATFGSLVGYFITF
jgi:hypothetical protein